MQKILVWNGLEAVCVCCVRTMHMLLIILNTYAVYISISIYKRAKATTPKTKIMCLWCPKKGKGNWLKRKKKKKKALTHTNRHSFGQKHCLYVDKDIFIFMFTKHGTPLQSVLVFGNAYRHQKPENGSKIYNIRYLNFSFRHQHQHTHTHTPNGDVNWIFS